MYLGRKKETSSFVVPQAGIKTSIAQIKTEHYGKRTRFWQWLTF